VKIRNAKASEKQELDLTSMIDVVFLLLIFFVMTFKIAEQEGDFSIRMPLAGSSSATMDNTELPMKLRMKADATGNLVSMSMNDIDLGTDFDALRRQIVSMISTDAPVPSGDEAAGPEVEIDTDFQLRYEYVIQAITAVSGYKDGDQVIKLIEKIKFAKPRRG
jgi:biopolymer transport protein ExbD